jgi:hypothetical protein
VKPSISRLALGFGLIAAAVLVRCLSTVHGGVVITLGQHVPAVTRIDLLTGPVALLGVALLASAPGLARLRRIGGLVSLVAAIGWPALKLGDAGAVLFTISARHGVHARDLIVFPVLAMALGMLAPWRAPLRWAPGTRGAVPGLLVPLPRP